MCTRRQRTDGTRSNGRCGRRRVGCSTETSRHSLNRGRCSGRQVTSQAIRRCRLGGTNLHAQRPPGRPACAACHRWARRTWRSVWHTQRSDRKAPSPRTRVAQPRPSATSVGQCRQAGAVQSSGPRRSPSFCGHRCHPAPRGSPTRSSRRQYRRAAGHRRATTRPPAGRRRARGEESARRWKRPAPRAQSAGARGASSRPWSGRGVTTYATRVPSGDQRSPNGLRPSAAVGLAEMP